MRFRRDSVIGILFLVGFGLVIFWVSWSSIIHRTLSGYQEFDLSVVGVVVVGGVGGLLWQLRRHAPGPVSLRVDSQGLDLAYPSGEHTIAFWSDPILDIDLLDFSGADPTVLRTADYPYRISIRGVQSLLTSEAYHALSDEIKRQGLRDTIGRGGTWLYPAKANPIVHHIRAGVPPPSTSH